MTRIDGRENDQLRPVNFRTDFVEYPEGSVLITVGKTSVICNVSIEDQVPPWMDSPESNRGWITAEYALLPRSTTTRVKRETHGFSGRTQEIKRLIGRSLRAGFDLDLLGKRTLIVDCDVLQADGGTRTAAITGGYLALILALKDLVRAGEIPPEVFLPPVAAVSVGLLGKELLLDLNYLEDAKADVDLNIVINGDGDYIEVQGTGEGAVFSRQDLGKLLDLAEKGVQELLKFQAEHIEE
jgi:ribonuclease PH